MKMIRHDNKGETLNVSMIMVKAHCVDDYPGQENIFEKTDPFMGNAGYGVHLSSDGYSASTKVFAVML